MSSVSQPDRILVFRIGQIGDTVAALPSLWVLRRHFPQATITLLSEAPVSRNHLPPDSVLPPEGLIDEFIKYPGALSLKTMFESWRVLSRLRRQGYTTLVYLAPSLRTVRQRRRDRLFFRLCRIDRILAMEGFPAHDPARGADGSLETVPKEADALLARLRRDGLDVPASDHGCMDLRLTEEERSVAQCWWKARKGAELAPRGWFVLCPGAKWPSKRWPMERYLETGRRLIQENGLLPVVVGGAEDRAIAEELIAGWGTGLRAAGDLTVRQSAALMENALFYLGNDTGAMHLAAAVGLPCVAVFSSQDWPGKWTPYGPGHEVLRFNVPCAGCWLNVCDRQMECLVGITVDEVVDACHRVLRWPAPPAASPAHDP